MHKWILLFVSIALLSTARASVLVKVDTVGASKKGQYVAIEEYGFTVDGKKSFAKASIINIWSNHSVHEVVLFADGANDEQLKKVRSRVRGKIRKSFKQFQIVAN